MSWLIAAVTQVVLLGTGTPSADPERSGPATAIVVDDTPYLVDFGPGVVRRASAAVAKGVKGLRLANLRVAFATHLHADHTMGYADLIITPWIAGRAAYRVDLDNRMAERGEKSVLVEAHEIQPGVVYRDDKITVTAFAVPHGDLIAYGFRFQTPDRVVVISGDTSRATPPSRPATAATCSCTSTTASLRSRARPGCVLRNETPS